MHSNRNQFQQQSLNESSKTDLGFSKSQSHFLSHNNSYMHGLEQLEEIKIGQNKRSNLFREVQSKSQSQKNNDNDDEDIVFDEVLSDHQDKFSQKNYSPDNRSDQQSSDMEEYFSSLSKNNRQSNLNNMDQLKDDNSSINSQSKKSAFTIQKSMDLRNQQSHTKEQKSFPTSSSNSSSSDDSDGSPHGSKNNKKKKSKTARSKQNENSMRTIRKKGDNDQSTFRKKRDNSRSYDHEVSGINNNMKMKKTSAYILEDQSANYALNNKNLKRRMSSKRQLNSKQIWQSKVFQIIMYINKLVFTLKKALIFTRPHLLTTLQLNLINDKSARDVGEGWGIREDKFHKFVKEGMKKYEFMGGFAKKYKHFRKQFKRKFKRILLCFEEFKGVLKKINKIIPVFNPMSRFLFFWEIIIFLISSFNFIFIPFDYSFQITGSMFRFFYFHQLSPAIFFADIAIRFNTSYFHRGYLVQERKKIIKNYLLNQFLVDLITSFSLFYNYFEFEGSYLLFFFRMFYFSKILDKMTESIMLNTKLSGTVSLLLLLAQVQFLCHIFTCAWHSLGQYELAKNGKSWLIQGQDLKDPISLYINSYYFCTITMTTIGFGDITPVTDHEKIFVSFMSILASGVFGYSLNFIGSILMDMKKQKELFQQRLAEINEYMRKHFVQSDLQSKTRKYLEYIHSEGVDKHQQPEKSLDYLSKFLKEEILKDVYLKSIKNIPIFENSFGQAFKDRLALRMKEQIYGPDEIIVKKGNYEIPRIYIIMKGEVELYWEVGSNKQIQTKQNEKKLKFMKEGSSFGFIEFFTGNYQSFVSAKSLGVSQIQYIQLDDFLDLLQDFENEKEIYCFIRDSVIIKKEYKMISVPCYSCSRYDHLINECPLLFYDSQKEKIIKTYNKGFVEQRKHFSRDLRRCRYQTLLQCKSQTTDIFNFREKTIFKTKTEITEDDSEDEYDDEYEYDDSEYDEEEKPKKVNNNNANNNITINNNNNNINNTNNDTNENSDSEEDEESKKSKRKKLRSQSVKQQPQNISQPRGSLLGEELLRQVQQRRSLLIQAFDEKQPSNFSINRLPSIGSRAQRLSIIDQLPKKSDINKSYFDLNTGVDTENTNENKKREKSEINQNLLKDYMYQHYYYQQQQQQQQSKLENFVEDRVCTFDIYFPHNNVKFIIDEIDRIKRKFRSKSIQRQRRTGLNNRLITLKQLHTLKTMFPEKDQPESHQNIP